MTIMEQLKAKALLVHRIAARHGARNVRIFGSVARGEAGNDSDVDILVAMDEDRSLLDLVAVERELAEILDCKVDVLVEGGISPYLEAQICAEAIPL